MKHEAEIDYILNIALPRESWMTHKEHKELVQETLNEIGTSKKELSDNIEVGVQNGYTVNQQIEILKQEMRGVNR